jgi:type IV pilus assembly protein PilC
MEFRYVARTSEGSTVRGVLRSETRDRALERLWQDEMTVLEMKPVRQRRLSLFGRRQHMLRPGTVALLSRQLAAMVDAGVGAIEALETIARQGGDPNMSEAMEGVIDYLEGGHSLADSFRHAGVFPSLFYRMISAGEASGSLEVTLGDLAEHYDREVWLSRKVRSALVYPKAVMFVAAVVVIFMIVYVFPYFVDLFFTLDMELPWPTLAVLSVADFAGRWWYLWLLLAVGGYFGWGRLMQVDSARLWWDKMYLKIPVMGELQWKMALDQMSATLATLLRSGLPLLEALDILQNAINNRHFAYCIGELEVYLRGGRSLSDSLARHQVFTPIMIRMVAVGEESGMLDEMLQKVSTFYHNEVEALTERLTQMLEPIIVVGLGVVVCFLLLAMYMPMFDAFRGVG